MISASEAARRRNRGSAGLASGNELGLPELRLSIAASFNLDLWPPYLFEALERIGVYARLSLAPFGQLANELLEPADEADAVVVVPAADDLLGAREGQLEGLLRTALERRAEAMFYVVVFGPEDVTAPHVLDPLAPERGQVEVERFLAEVRGLGALSQRVVVVDWEWASRGAAAAYRDPRLWYLARMRLNPQGLAALADAVAEHVSAALGATRKVVAVDLDGVLWGGIVGEAGVGGIELGDEGVGLAYRDFQRELRELSRAGVLLATVSKNNPDDVADALDSHPAMVLRRDDFAALHVGWDDKATGLMRIADELGLALDSFVLLDDDAVERGWVRAALPEVLVPELPEDPVERPAFLRRAPWFRRIRVTEADAGRSESYRARSRRTTLAQTAVSLDDFLESLGQIATVEPLNDGSIARAAQLAQRTNQFNLTLRRYTVAELEAIAADAASEAYTLALDDRFGASGTVGLAIVRFCDDAAEIEAFLVSCRALGRRIEDALLAFVSDQAHGRGARLLVGRIVEGPRNQQAAGFYARHGFARRGDGYALDLERSSVPSPAGVAVRAVTRA